MEGPRSYRNWKMALAGEPWQSMFEYPLFTDAPHIVGDDMEELGPYEILNIVPIQSHRPRLMLRAKDHLSHQYQLPDFKKTEDDYYHGGYEVDEIAALLSLCMGIRLKAGAPSRGFGNGGDPKGRPIDHGVPEDPDLSTVRAKRKELIFPIALQDSSLAQIGIFASFPLLTSTQAIALVRAARMYQEAIWIIEVSPELSWLMLVSCVEIIANQWREDNASPVEGLAASQRGLELIKILHQYGGDQKEKLVSEVAQQLASLMGATKKFKDFIMGFLPPEPPKRPSEFAQHSWKPSKIKQSLDRIYECRSDALHEGKPFPAPMCQPPWHIDGVPAEVPNQMGAGMRGSVWTGKSIPMHLHIFEYIARNAILNWWKSVTGKE